MRRHLLTALFDPRCLLRARCWPRRSGRPARRPPARPPLTLTTTAFADGAPDPGEVHPGRRAGVARARLDQRAARHAELRAAHARPRRGPQQDHRGSGALAGVEHPRHRHRHGRGPAQGRRPCPTAAARSAPAARSTAAPARRPPGRCTTTPSSSSRSTPRSTCRPAPTPGRRARRSTPPCRATSWARRSTSGCSAARSRTSR